MAPVKYEKNVLPSSLVVQHAQDIVEKRSRPMQRPGLGNRGQRIRLVTNHFKVSLSPHLDNAHFYQYNVNLSYDDGKPVEGAVGIIGRKIIDNLRRSYAAELSGKELAYDGDHTLFTVGPLPANNLSFSVALDDVLSAPRQGHEGDGAGSGKRAKMLLRTKIFKVDITYSTKIPMLNLIAPSTSSSHPHQDSALRVLDTILRQNAARRGCLLVRQAFFSNDYRNLVDIGGGLQGCRGFSSSFHTTQSGLSLNFDVTTTVTIKAQPVLAFLKECELVKTHNQVDWIKAKRILRNLRVKVRSSPLEFKICGLSEKPCNQQLFTLKRKEGDEVQSVDITVYDYFLKHRNIGIYESASYPCLNVGKQKRPTYYPIELCDLLPLQRYTKALSAKQRSELVDKTRQKPQERTRVLENALRRTDYNKDPMLHASGISTDLRLTEVNGRVLSAPQLRVGQQEALRPQNGRWNFMQKTLYKPAKLENWSVVNFSTNSNVRRLCQDLVRSAGQKGMYTTPPHFIIDEDREMRHAPPAVRVEKMFEKIRMSHSKSRPTFILCFLPEKKNSSLYGPWKRKNLVEHGIFTQCLAPERVNDQYLTNVVLKINAKLGGINSVLECEIRNTIPYVSQQPTLIIGMDVCHNSPGQIDVPSFAAVAGSIGWPLISQYKAVVRAQSPKHEMIDSLFKETSVGDDGIMRELLQAFYGSTGKMKPENIIIFRDGVGDSQFNQVLNEELDQIIKACELLDRTWFPKFMVIVAQKNHHTRFFQPQSPDNIPPGTVIDTQICHPRNHDFYMCAHRGIIGTSRPVHYHVLLDQIGFTADELQELVHSLSYVYQRSSTAVSLVAPICYAHLAAAQVSQFVKSDTTSESIMSDAEVTPLPPFHNAVKASMFFC